MSWINTQNLGYPRVGERCELKKASEAIGKGSSVRGNFLLSARPCQAICLRLTSCSKRSSRRFRL